MSLYSIKDKLEILGYDVTLKQDGFLSVGKILRPSEIDEDIFLMDFYCFVTLKEGGTYVILYGTSNYQPRVDISTEPEVINWIKKQYPL